MLLYDLFFKEVINLYVLFLNFHHQNITLLDHFDKTKFAKTKDVNWRVTHGHLPLHLVLHICVELELVGFESHGKVALGDPVPASLEGHLVASQPALIADHSGAVDGCAVDVVVNVTADVDVVALVARLELAALLAGEILRRGAVV